MTKFEVDAAPFERNGGKKVRFEPGQTIVTEGEPGRVMYVIRSGEVGLQADGEDLATLWPGDVFGEMSMIDGSTRSATATAKSDVEAIILDREAFLAVVRDTPEFAMHILTVLSVRVRELSYLV